MTLTIAPEAQGQLKKLPKRIQTKAGKQFRFLLHNVRHPSLRTQKMANTNTFEGRIDIHYRFTFDVEGEELQILTIGMHDTGLGKK